MIIYIDVYFFINLIIDYIILCTATSFKKNIFIRRFLGAFFGSFYACLYFFDIPWVFFKTGVKLIVLLVMVLFVVFPCGIKLIMKNYMVVFFTSVFLCGMIYTAGNYFAMPLKQDMFLFSDVLIILCAGAGYLFYCLWGKFLKKQLLSASDTLKIYYNGKNVEISAITDTGNSLCDPVSGYPVIVVDESVLKKLIHPEVLSNNLSEFVNPVDFRIIPYRTISSSGILYGFIPEKVILRKNTYTQVIIAVSPAKLKKNALISPQLL